jgi:hypothetical protein
MASEDGKISHAHGSVELILGKWLYFKSSVTFHTEIENPILNSYGGKKDLE